MLENTKLFLALKRPKKSTAPKRSGQYLFNQHNLGRYESDVKKGLELIKRTIAENDQPFSGILPQELAPAFKDINLDQPLKKTHKALDELAEVYLKDAVYFHNPRYVAHLNCPIVYPTVMAELILSSINTSVDTWDQSAGATFIEQKLVDWTIGRIGYGENADGVFTSGGTQSNLMAMLLARDHYCETQLDCYSVKEQGLPKCADKFRIFTSDLSHFSIQKSAALLGLGYDSVVAVAHDELFQMDAKELEAEIEKAKACGLIPIAVMATTGTTDFGSIDPIDEISTLCKKHDLWMHADAAYGCGILASNKHRDKLAGIEKADSVTVDYHKSFFQPVSCGAFFTKHKEKLGYVTHHADYLNPLSATQEGTPNLVNKSMQTTRRFDALKLWLTLRIMGADNIGAIFDEVILRAEQTYNLFISDGNIDVLHKPQLSTLVFRFHPAHSSLKPLVVDDELINQCNESIRKTISRSGRAVVAGTKVNGISYLKFTLLNPETSMLDIEEILQMIKQAGQEFVEEKIKPLRVSANEGLSDPANTSFIQSSASNIKA
ncbi:MAG: L-2,4-diaminobutyrate decarboxylase [Oleiphilaceae bacterium]|jgi:L-2,4-diaminobutyrate decarboxylase